MNFFTELLIGLIALEHAGFLVLEMFLWTRPAGMRVFGLAPEQAQSSRVLAANQGLYNGFLAAGLLWGLLQGTGGIAVDAFFLACVLAAGIFGGATASWRIALVQGAPAALALLLLGLG